MLTVVNNSSEMSSEKIALGFECIICTTRSIERQCFDQEGGGGSAGCGHTPVVAVSRSGSSSSTLGMPLGGFAASFFSESV